MPSPYRLFKNSSSGADSGVDIRLYIVNTGMGSHTPCTVFLWIRPKGKWPSSTWSVTKCAILKRPTYRTSHLPNVFSINKCPLPHTLTVSLKCSCCPATKSPIGEMSHNVPSPNVLLSKILVKHFCCYDSLDFY